MKRVRTFIAIDLPSNTKEKIFQTIESLDKSFKKYSKNLSWEEAQKLHITLVFIGSIPEDKLPEIFEIVDSVAKTNLSFEVGLGIISYFYTDKKSSDSKIYIDLIDKEKNIPNLFKNLAKKLSESGFSPPNRINPHITLGSLAKQHRQQQVKILEEISSFNPDYLNKPKEERSFQVTKISVFESINMRPHTRYRLIRSFDLQ